MKIARVKVNNRRKAFEITAGRRLYLFPYAKLEVRPAAADRVTAAYIDKELGGDAFSYRLESGAEGTVHLDHVLEYNQDPAHMRDLLLYKLTLEVQRRVARTALSRRELIRRLHTSPAQFYRLLDQTNYRKSVDQLLHLLRILDCDVDLVIRERAA
ncbi:MAG: hypothetical protein ABSA52_19570 [Candidatus Binatia bacterium]|jgi:hypothetical protein